MPLLALDKLTLRFGGITAVKDFSLQVEPGEITSIIGPNGAGKTTVFNAISGIYPPTSGVIRFHDRELALPITWRVWTACALVAILTALGLMLLAANIDLLWRAAVRRPFDIEQHYRTFERDSPLARPFRYGEVFSQAAAYLRGDITLEPQRGKWRVISPDGLINFGRVATETEARELRDALNTHLHDDKAMGTLPGKDEAQTKLLITDLHRVRDENKTRSTRMTLGLLGGAIFGFAGYFAVWNRSRRSPDVISRAGIARTFQNIRLFHNMTVLENVLVGLDRAYSTQGLGSILRTPGFRKCEQKCLAQAQELLEFVGLDDKRDSLAKNLPYGDQRRLEIARALATRPQLVLLDEPAAGMNPSESEELMHLIRRIRDRGVTVLLIEHHMKLVMGISDRIAVLEFGVKIAEGTPDEVRANPSVIKAYLGDEEVT